MAEITRKRTGEFLRKLFSILLAEPTGIPARDALDRLRTEFQLTDYEKGNYAGGALRFDKIVRFATVDCVKAGWLAKHKGTWSVTDLGKEALKKYSDPEEFYKEAVKLYRKWKAGQEPSDEGDGGSEGALITIEEAEEQAWQQIEEFLRKMNPYDFQELVAALLKALGYHVAWVAPPGKDGGIDVLAWNDPLGTKPPRIKVQVKRTSQAVSVEGLRSFMAVLGEDDVGLFVSVSGFTKDAEDEARKQENRKVTLVDLEKLFDLWVENYARLEDGARRRFPITPVYFLAPED